MARRYVTRLSTINPDLIAVHMSDPRMAEHMPFLSNSWDIAQARDFVAAKEAT